MSDTLAMALGIEDARIIQEILSDSVSGQTGKVEFPETNGYISVPRGYMFLNKEQSNHLLVEYWGNLQDEDLLGTIVLDSAKIYDEIETAFIIYYEDCGYVKDDDASEIDYDEVLNDIRESLSEQNEQAKEQGLSQAEVLGWAEPPYYDKDKKVLHWAKQVRFTNDEGESSESLNYDIRVLGRKGMFLLMAVGDMENLPSIKGMCGELLDNVKFQEGYTYADFDSTKDNIAEWTIGGLIAGNVLAKTGILAKLGLLLVKFWKIILVVFVAFGAFLKKFFGKQTSENDGKSGDDTASRAEEEKEK